MTDAELSTVRKMILPIHYDVSREAIKCELLQKREQELRDEIAKLVKKRKAIEHILAHSLYKDQINGADSLKS